MSLSRSKSNWKERQNASEPTAAERASKLLHQARLASRTQSTAVTRDAGKKQYQHHQGLKSEPGELDEDGFEKRPDKAVTLHDLLKILTTQEERPNEFLIAANVPPPPPPLTMREAMPVAGKLFSKGYNSTKKLAKLSLTLLEEMGIEGEEVRKKTVRAVKGTAAVPEDRRAKRTQGSDETGGPRKRRRDLSPGALGRDWGDMDAVKKKGKEDDELVSFVFNEVLEESAIRGKFVMVNRAPVMTAWATVVLEKLGFERDEALSLAHCYVNATSTARGRAIGVIPEETAKEKEINRVGTNQPHFELMRIRIPVMQLQNGAYRGISKGEVIGPEKAFNYIRNAMFQTLPMVMGALYLLADSYIESGDSGTDALHNAAYSLYTEFRPETEGVWGKKARLDLDVILNLRKGARTTPKLEANDVDFELLDLTQDEVDAIVKLEEEPIEEV